jgi:hypothetical protein
MSSSVTARAKAALAAALRRERGDRIADDLGYARRLEDNLVSTLTPATIQRVRAEFGGGAGDELGGARPKLHAAYSSAALAANAFGAWRNSEADIGQLSLAGVRGFQSMRFEERCATGLPGIPPHLDVLATGRHVVGIESKCTEHLSDKAAAFRPSYERAFFEAAPSWGQRYRDALDPGAYRLLDVAQLLKHYLGLRRRFAGTPTTLLYVYWEPSSPEVAPEFARHRDEIERFADGLEDPGVTFAAQSYAELWSDWERQPTPPWLRDHVAELRRRYVVEI